jgi:hypothetical protein
MTEDSILKIVKEAFDEEISSSASETVLGLESHIEGEKEFFEKLKDKLKILCDQEDIYNNLSK